jgi:predicted nuclease with TOPRIM domain
MGSADNLVNDIAEKVKKLIARHNNLIAENVELKEKQKSLKETLENQHNLIKQLKDKNRNLKIAKSVKLGEGNSDVKIKIDELVREIDKCIGLLNK